MVKKIYNCYINSENRDRNEPVYDFRIDFPQGHINAEEHETISLNVLSFDMMNSMYNVSSTNNNNQFTIKKTDANGTANPLITTYTIPNGNYDVHSFNTILNGLLSGIITITYNTYQNSYTYTKIDTSTSRYFLNPIKSTKLLGISTTTEILSTGTTGTYVNMVNYNKIVLKVNNVAFDRSGFQNLSDEDNVLNNGDILLWVTKSDVPPFRMISYENIDGGNSFNTDLYEKSVDALNLVLMNEYNNYITDAPNFMLALQFIVSSNEEKTINATVKKILLQLTEVFDVFVVFLKYIGFFRDIQK
jgi:hypothetical protein